MLEAALDYFRRGWSVFPVNPGSKRTPVRWKRYQSERASEAQVENWFSNEQYGIGVIFGEVSGNLVSRDFDDTEVYKKWATKHPRLASTLPTVATARGRHVYATASADHIADLRGLIGKPDGTGALVVAGGELRCGVGCYSVLPPSVHPSGRVYEWIVPLPAGPLPEVDLITCDFFAPLPTKPKKSVTQEGAEFPPSFPPKGRREFPTPTAGEDVAHREPCNREHREYRGSQRLQKTTEAISGVCDSKQKRQIKTSKKGADPQGWSEAVQWAIVDSVPDCPGQRHRQVFELARGLKAVPELADAAAGTLKPYVQQWHRLSVEKIKTKPFTETWIDFLKAWPRVQYPKGADPMTVIFERAAQQTLPDVAEDYDQDALRLLVALCRELQRSAASGPFYLSCRTAGRLLGVDHTTANRWLFLMINDGILEVTEPGERAKRKAARYRYLGDL